MVIGNYLRTDYLIRLGIAQRGLPRISTLLPHENLIASAVSDDRRFAATVSSDGSMRYWKARERDVRAVVADRGPNTA